MNNKAFVLKTLLLIIAVGIVISSYNITSILMDYKESNAVYDEIASFAVEEDGEEKGDTKPEKTTPDLKIDFASLNKLNSDVKGWLYSENLGINYPVLQGEDNNQYLRHLPNGEYSSSGTLFIDYRNKENDKHILIYGHNMKDGSMFGKLSRYADQEYYEQHPELYFYTEEGEYRLKIFSAYYTNDDDFTYSVSEQSDANEYSYYAGRKSCIDTDTEYQEGDCIITLSTCAYLRGHNRFVVQCIPYKVETK